MQRMLKNLCALPFGLALILSACVSAPSGIVSPYRLAAFSQNDVSVAIVLQQDGSGNVFLAATFTPLNGDHLYSKDIPRQGVEGEGRPTLLELTPQSGLRAMAGLTANVDDEVPSTGPEGLKVYPPGPVTLRLPVSLPAGRGWYDDQVSVTYMACSQTTCKAPVIGKIVRVHLPRDGDLQP
jgi:hypothetical protein